MQPSTGEMTVPSESSVPNARAFVRSLNVLLKYCRLYGLEHLRSAGQFEVAWNELEEAVRSAGQAGLLLGSSGSQLLLDGVPLESTQAERSFADLLNTAGVASIAFLPSVERGDLTNLIKAFMETGPKAGPLTERLEQYFGSRSNAGIHVNEIRFVAEDAAFSEARMAAQLTVKTLGGDAERVQDWFRSPEKMIQLIAAAEGSRGGPGGPGTGAGPGTGGGTGTGGGAGSGPGTGSGAGTGGGVTGVYGAGGSGTGGPGSGGGSGLLGGLISGAPGGGGVAGDLPAMGEAEMTMTLANSPFSPSPQPD